LITPDLPEDLNTTIRNSLVLSALKLIDSNISNCGKLNEWFPLAKDESEWNEHL
jgi:hypothetical protein